MGTFEKTYENINGKVYTIEIIENVRGEFNLIGYDNEGYSFMLTNIVDDINFEEKYEEILTNLYLKNR